MRINALIFLLFCLISSVAHAQENFVVKGIVSDGENKESLPLANVFLAETTYGVVTDLEGRFELVVEKPGTYDLIVKFVGYKTYSAQLKLEEDREINLNIELQIEEVSLGSYTLVAKKNEEWRRHLEEFKRIFLGQSFNARSCKIKNEEDLDFFFDRDNNTLEAFSQEPLIIENKALGYTVKYYLEQFLVDYRRNLSSYYGFTVFEEMNARTARRERKWEESRKIAYEGSALHFFSSLYKDRLEEEGFIVQMARDVEGVGRVIDPKNANIYPFLVDGSNDLSKSLPFNNIMYITYTKEVTPESYVASRGGISLGHVSVSPARRKEGQRSWITVSEGFHGIEFEESGYVYNPLSFYSNGYWGFEKIAEMVPINYRPKDDN